MSAAFDKALATSRGFVTSMSRIAVKLHEGGIAGPSSFSPGSMFGDSGQQRRDRERYGLFRGWLYSAIHARAEEAAKQPVHVARMTNATPNPDERSAPNRVKAYQRKSMPDSMRGKSSDMELEIIRDHPLVDALERPNLIQNRWQFVYNFFANLDLTGWSYVVADKAEDGRPVFYSLPTTWIRPDHEKGAFTGFRVSRPGDVVADDTVLDRSQVTFAYLPNPADPLLGYAPSASQMSAIRIDEHIQTSQDTFFHKSVLPSMIVTIGGNPMGDGRVVRPRLSISQREQIESAIMKSMGTFDNYGGIGFVDGLVEKFESMSAKQNEMGWDKSEDKVKARILSAFRVHSYILGEHVSIGGHAQVANIEKRFCAGVNTGLDLLSTMMTQFLGPQVSQDERTLIWWDKCEAVDVQLEQQNWLAGRKNGDITENEWRAKWGMPPDEDKNQDFIGQKGAHVNQTLTQLGQGLISVSQAKAVFVAHGIPNETADNMAGDGVNREEETTEDAIEALELAASALGVAPENMAVRITELVK